MKHGLAIPALAVLALVLAAGCTTTAPPAGGPSAPSPAETTATVTAAPAGPRPPSTSLELMEYVDDAAVWAQKNGRAAALAAFNNKTGPFVTGDVYIYALDYSGIALALPFQPGKVGTDFRPVTDAAGKPYTDIEIQLAQGGGGYLLYRYPYPGSNTSRLKISYVRPVDDTYWIGAGVYTSEERLVDAGLRSFVAGARAYALANGREKALAAFNNASGPFISGDLYVFAYDYNGTVLAWPYRPDMLGVNRFNDTDAVGQHHIQAMINLSRAGGGMVDYYSTDPFTNTTELKVSWMTDVDGTWLLGAGRYIVPGPMVLRE